MGDGDGGRGGGVVRKPASRPGPSTTLLFDANQ